MKSSGIGGQAVLEGVMMRNQSKYAVAVRMPDGKISVTTENHKNLTEKSVLFRVPFIRGIFAFADSLVIGMKTLNYSSIVLEEAEEEETTQSSKKDVFENIMIVLLSIVLALGIFVVVPVVLSELIGGIVNSDSWLAVIEGVIRLVMFLGYLLLISCMKDIRRTFMYHGAEHMTINCVEQGLELNVANVQKMSRKHRRCGTSFLLVVMIVSIVFFALIRTDNMVLRLVLRIVLIPVVAGVSYEFIRLAGNTDNPIIVALSQPGLWLQRLTTREPEDEMVEVAIASVEAVFDWKAYQQKMRQARMKKRKNKKEVQEHREDVTHQTKGVTRQTISLEEIRELANAELEKENAKKIEPVSSKDEKAHREMEQWARPKEETVVQELAADEENIVSEKKPEVFSGKDFAHKEEQTKSEMVEKAQKCQEESEENSSAEKLKDLEKTPVNIKKQAKRRKRKSEKPENRKDRAPEDSAIKEEKKTTKSESREDRAPEDSAIKEEKKTTKSESRKDRAPEDSAIKEEKKTTKSESREDKVPADSAIKEEKKTTKSESRKDRAPEDSAIKEEKKTTKSESREDKVPADSVIKEEKKTTKSESRKDKAPEDSAIKEEKKTTKSESRKDKVQADSVIKEEKKTTKQKKEKRDASEEIKDSTKAVSEKQDSLIDKLFPGRTKKRKAIEAREQEYRERAEKRMRQNQERQAKEAEREKRYQEIAKRRAERLAASEYTAAPTVENMIADDELTSLDHFFGDTENTSENKEEK